MFKIIFKLFVEIIMAVYIIFLTFNITNNNQIVSNAFIYNNGNKEIGLIEIKPLELSNIFPITDENAINNYEKSKYKIINNNTNIINYSIIYRITNTIDYNFFNYYLKIYNEEIKDSFKNCKIKYNNEYTDIIIYEGIINSKEEIDFEYLLWLDYRVDNEAQNKSFSGQIVIETY